MNSETFSYVENEDHLKSHWKMYVSITETISRGDGIIFFYCPTYVLDKKSSALFSK